MVLKIHQQWNIFFTWLMRIGLEWKLDRGILTGDHLNEDPDYFYPALWIVLFVRHVELFQISRFTFCLECYLQRQLSMQALKSKAAH